MADTIDESTETFSLNLSNISGATFAKNEAEYSIIAQIENKPENLTLIGDNNPNTLVGGNGNDGDDLIIGEAGSDRLTGGNGIDRFRFLSLNERTDRIVDFVVADDIIEVSASFGGGLIAGSTISSNQFVIGASALAPSDRFIYDSSNGALWFDRDGTGSNSQVKIATLSSGLSLTFEDIVVI